MKFIFKKFYHQKIRTLLQMGIFFILASLLFISQMMTSANEQLAKMIENDTDLYFYIVGNINDYEAENTKEGYQEISVAYEELFDKIKTMEGIDYADKESFLYSRYIYTCQNMSDADNYDCLYIPRVPEDYYNFERHNDNEREKMRFSQTPLGLSDEESLKRYAYFGLAEDVLGDIDPDAEGEFNFFPSLIGVEQTDFADLKNYFTRIIEGTTFSKEDLSEGRFKAIVPSLSFFAGAKDVDTDIDVHDTFTLTFRKGDIEKSYEFEIIGLHDGIESYDLPTIDTPVCRNIYIPAKTLDIIASDYQEWLSENLSEDEIDYTYGDLKGYKPLMFNVEERGRMKDILSEITPKIKTLSELDGGYPYSYVSSLDDYADAITMSESNSFVFTVLNYILISLTLITLIIINVYNINTNKKEIGIQNAMGKKKSRINFDLFKEFLLINIIPIILAVIVSSIFTKVYAENEFSYQTMKILSGEYNPHFYDASGTGKLTKTFEVSFGVNDYLFLLALWFIISAVAFIFTYFKMKSLDPKIILLMGEKE